MNEFVSNVGLVEKLSVWGFTISAGQDSVHLRHTESGESVTLYTATEVRAWASGFVRAYQKGHNG